MPALVPALAATAGAQESQALVSGSPREARLTSYGLFPHLASRSSGAQAVVWEEAVGGGRVVHLAERQPGQVWSDPVPLSKPEVRAERPKVALGPGGRVAVAWFEGTGVPGDTDTEIVVASRSAGSWSTVQLTDDATSNYDPQLEYDAQGRLVVLWYDNLARTVEAARLVPGGAEPVTTTVWTAPTGHAPGRPQLDVNPAGEAVALWVDRRTATSPRTLRHRMASMTTAAGWRPSVEVGRQGPETGAALDGAAVIDRAGIASVVTAVGADAASPVEVTRRTRGGATSTKQVGLGSMVDATVDDSDVLTTAWSQPRGLVRTKHLRRGSWSGTTSVPRSAATSLRLASTPVGADSVSYAAADGALHVAHRGAGTTTWSGPRQVLAPAKDSHPRHELVRHGNDASVVAWLSHVDLPPGPVVTRTVDRTAPSVRMVSPAGTQRVGSGQYTVSWRGSDVWSPPVTFTVQRKVGTARWRHWVTTTGTTKVTSLQRGVRQCFRVRGRDASANLSGWSAAGCVVRR